MSKPFRLSSLAWMIAPLAALVFLFATNRTRARHVLATSALVADLPAPDPASPTGYAGGTRVLIVPEHNGDSYHWIVQTQQMLAQGDWRVRHIDYENAPFGRVVYFSSPYRWWLGLVAWADHVRSGRPLGQSVERAALAADPLLQALLLVAAAAFVAWRFGSGPAALVSVGIVALFPFAGEFLPGEPENRGLALAALLGSILTLLAAVAGGPGPAPVDPARAGRATRRWFFAAGVIGGLGLWISVTRLVPVLAGLGAGGLLAAWLTRGDPAAGAPRFAWRAWALGGALTTLLVYLVEFYPAHLGDWQLRAVHPLYGVAWLGGGEVLARLTAWLRGEKPGRRPLDFAAWLLAAAALAAVPFVMGKTKTKGFLEVDLSATRLVRLPDSPVAPGFATWLFHDGFTATVLSVLLPLLLVLPALYFLGRRTAAPGARAALAVAFGPVLAAFGFASCYLSWWSGLGAALLALLVAATAALPDHRGRAAGRWVWMVFVGLLLLPGLRPLIPPAGTGGPGDLREPEVFGLVERDLARWLAGHIGAKPAVVLAPHHETSTLFFYGGLRGLGTLTWENQDGISAAVRIVSASTPEEARELIEKRGITHLVLPSWDNYLEVYARMGMGQLDGTFLSRVLAWKLPPWLKPVPYEMPVLHGFEGQAVTVLEVVEDQEDAAALSRTAEYFVEMKQVDKAVAAGQALRRFPADLGALVARAEVENAAGDAPAFARTVELLKPRLSGGADRSLPWDRRVSLAVVLARGKQTELARAQVKRCLEQVDEARLRSLTTGSLYRLQVLAKAFELPFADPQLQALARDLLPAGMRGRL